MSHLMIMLLWLIPSHWFCNTSSQGTDLQPSEPSQHWLIKPGLKRLCPSASGSYRPPAAERARVPACLYETAELVFVCVALSLQRVCVCLFERRSSCTSEFSNGVTAKITHSIFPFVYHAYTGGLPLHSVENRLLRGGESGLLARI